ncbi:hypothetical protein C0991_001998 [Blastosporella zonata]|nr:hypothetical protein C0991_001998 [Blastosporella zonata]
MLNLQEKAHYSLDEFRKGQGSPLSKYNLSSPTEVSPTNDDDELSILGGKTRLVAKKEPSSPTLLDRSPTSQRPVIPLELHRVDPGILEYLESFNPQESQQLHVSSLTRHDSTGSTSGGSSHHRGSFSEDLSPVSMYGMSTMPTSPTFQTEPTSYISHQYPQSSPTHQYSPHHTKHPQMMGGIQQGTSAQTFPHYFPVYDYGTNMVNGGGNVNGVNGAGNYDTPMLDAHPIPHSQRRASGSPEGNMQTTWNEFVAGFAGV